MKKFILSIILVLISNFSFSQLFINELDSDTPSTDDKEFIELKSTVPNFSLNGYVIVLFNGTGTLINRSYYVIDLTGFSTDVNGIFVLGNNLVAPVPDKYLPDSIIQNGPDGVGLYLGSSSDFPNNTLATTTNLVDAIVYGTNDPDATSLMGLLGVATQINESNSTVNSMQRKNDGTYEAKPATPGANNDGSGFIYNGITIAVDVSNKNEGTSFPITFTTQTNVTSNLSFNFTLNNDTFTTADFSGNTTVSIPVGSNSFTTTITLIDDVLDEGDEVLKIKFGNLPSGYNRRNDNIEIRVVDNDFVTLPFGTPVNPTYGNVTSTVPVGYYASLEGLSGAALKQALQDIIANPNVVHAHSYGDITDILKVADQNPLNSNQVWLMYKETPRAKLDFQTGSSNIGKWNREHIYPQSRGGFQDGTSDTPDGINVWLPTSASDILAGHGDAHHLRAEDGPENSSRGNKNYGLDGYNGPTGNLSSWKGDVARSIFYMCVRYNGLNVVNGNLPETTVGQIGDLATLLTWNNLDPRDDFEMNRNNYIYTWQVNRNPFIDYPNLADYIFGANVGQPWFSTLSNEVFSDSKIVLYPNPIKNQFTISGISQESTIEIYNNIGSKVFESNFNNDAQFNVDFAAGIYFAKITSDAKTSTKKIIVK